MEAKPRRKGKDGFYARYVKRGLDILCALMALLLLWPLLLLVALLVRVKLGKPVLFRQKRAGKDEQIFTLCKFRSMRDACDKNGRPLSDEARLTPFGRALRRSSLDELPELYNILKGDMSVVGPRPLLVRYLPYYTPQERRRHDVRPGLTGLAQVRGRNLVSWDERFATDVWYAGHMSLRLDCAIVFRTVLVLFRRGEVRTGSENTMKDLDDERRDTLYMQTAGRAGADAACAKPCARPANGVGGEL